MSAERAEEHEIRCRLCGTVLGVSDHPPALDLLADAQRRIAELEAEAAENEEIDNQRAREFTALRERAAALEDVIRDLFHATAQHHCKVCREAMKRHAELIRSCEITRAAPRPAYRRKKPA